MARYGELILSDDTARELERRVLEGWTQKEWKKKAYTEKRLGNISISSYYKALRQERQEKKTLYPLLEKFKFNPADQSLYLDLDGEDNNIEEGKPEKPIRSVVEVMDAEFVKEGQEQGVPEEITRQKLAESRRMADRYEELLAQGHTEAQIDALWANKTPQEILAETHTTDRMPQAESMEDLSDKLTQALNGLQDHKIDAIINAFNALSPWDFVPHTPRGDKINKFVLWAYRAGKQAEAYQRATNPR